MEEVKHWKTTAQAVVVAAAGLLHNFGIFELSPEAQQNFTWLILFSIALFSGGSNKKTDS